ncbi:MAG: molybdopterin-dependent oxidoreductase, partial [Nocardioides sp.]|nr:molybdopterin-dependent oxidoreductase [Nocardioides sp.]
MEPDQPALPSWWPSAQGAVAVLLGLATGHLVAGVTEPDTSPVLAVGSAAIDRSPPALKEWAIRELGTADKPVLVGTVLLVVLALGAALGRVAVRRPSAAAAGLAGLALVGALAAATRPAAGTLDVLPSLVAGAASVAALRWLVSAGRTGDRATDGAGPSRRGVVLATGALAGAAVAGGAAGQWLASSRAVPAISLPTPADPAPPFPAGLERTVPGITPLRTPPGEFYRVDTRLVVPRVDVDDWTLTIDGDVDRVVEIGFDDLAAMRLVERDITLTCVSNEVGGPYVGGARWLGVPLRDVLDLAGIDGTAADQVLSTDVGGMTISTPLGVALDGRDSLIAIGMNGAPLPRAHGFPARMVVPGLYGYVGACKWISRMTLTTYAEQQAYWTERDWAVDGPVKVSSRVDTPRPFSDQPPGRVAVG